MGESRSFSERDCSADLDYSASNEPQDVLLMFVLSQIFFFFSGYLFCIALLLFGERTDF